MLEIGGFLALGHLADLFYLLFSRQLLVFLQIARHHKVFVSARCLILFLTRGLFLLLLLIQHQLILDVLVDIIIVILHIVLHHLRVGAVRKLLLLALRVLVSFRFIFLELIGQVLRLNSVGLNSNFLVLVDMLVHHLV